ncbi:MAG: ATP synthase F1 subunit delta [Clostridia bacterium]|nr:ATP synthase F1 subunit delta [Clostridia bacterium]
MTELAREYGDGLYALCEEENISQDVLDQMLILSRLFKEQPDFTRLLGNMSLSKEERVKILDSVLRSQVHLYLLNFLKILCERGALNEYEGCLAAFKTLYNQAHGIVEASVTTAVALDDEQRARMTEKLSKMTGKKVVLIEKIDASLVGGVLLEMNGQRYDNTLKNRLKSIHSAMVQGA